MSYENAPATKLLATHCCCCGRSLVDAISVERGIGPDCAEKYGYFEAQVPINLEQYCNLVGEIPLAIYDETFDRHKEVNKLVYEIASKSKNEKDVPSMIMMIYHLGFHVLATKLSNKIYGIEVKKSNNGDYYNVFTPFSRDWLFNVRGIKGRKWNSVNKCWEIPLSQRMSLWNAIKVTFPGFLVIGNNGIKKAI